MRNIHEEYNKMICGFCGHQSSSLRAFGQHRRKRHLNLGFVCEVCGKIYDSNARLKMHTMEHLPEDQRMKFACSYCGKCFKNEFRVQLHEQIHTYKRTFACDICPKKFFMKLRLEEHMQLHTQEFQFHCKICNAKFTRLDNMNTHMKHNHRIICSICNLTFTTGEEVKIHRAETHTHEEIEQNEAEGHSPFYKFTDWQCTFCQRFLASKQSLGFHLATHTGEGRKRPSTSKSKDDNPAAKTARVTAMTTNESQEETANLPVTEPQPINAPVVVVHTGEEKQVVIKKTLEVQETLEATYNLVKSVMDPEVLNSVE